MKILLFEIFVSMDLKYLLDKYNNYLYIDFKATGIISFSIKNLIFVLDLYPKLIVELENAIFLK